MDSQKTFGIKCPFSLHAYESANAKELAEYVPEKDEHYFFDEQVTQAVLAGFMFNHRVLLQGFHGTGKSSHVEQIAARLNWPLVRINLDGHVSRIDLIGRDAIVLKEGKQVTTFKEGILPWALEHGIGIVLDEYDAGRPDVMFVLQRLLEANGKLTLPEQNRVVEPHPNFRIFATANTVGLGDATGMYHGTNPINQGQMDRWNSVVRMDYMSEAREVKMVSAKVPDMDKATIGTMVKLANLAREGFKNGDLSSVMSPRAVLAWAQSALVFGDVPEAFKLSFLNKCDQTEYSVLAEYYQRCFGEELALS